MTAYYILHVEDDDTKARSVQRLLRSALDATGYLEHMREIEILRAHSLDEARSVLACETPKDDVLVGVVTDWRLPETWSLRADGKNGAAVVSLCRSIGVPTIIVSGDTRPEHFEDSELVKWAPALELREALTAFGRTAAERTIRLAVRAAVSATQVEHMKITTSMTVTGRHPSEPALQRLPPRTEEAKELRDALSTPSDAMRSTFEKGGYSELELRALALLKKKGE